MASSDVERLNELLAKLPYVDGFVPTQADVFTLGCFSSAPSDAQANVLRWWKHMASFSADERARWPQSEGGSSGAALVNGATASAAADDDDEDIDLFGSDEDDADAEKERIKEERLKAYAEKKSKKPGPIAKSSVVFDVKPWDDECDLAEVERQVRLITLDGLLWGAAKLMPVAYGIKKLQIGCVVEDEKVSTDWLEEQITNLEDLVQSVDIAAFQKGVPTAARPLRHENECYKRVVAELGAKVWRTQAEVERLAGKHVSPTGDDMAALKRRLVDKDDALTAARKAVKLAQDEAARLRGHCADVKAELRQVEMEKAVFAEQLTTAMADNADMRQQSEKWARQRLELKIAQKKPERAETDGELSKAKLQIDALTAAKVAVERDRDEMRQANTAEYKQFLSVYKELLRYAQLKLAGQEVPAALVKAVAGQIDRFNKKRTVASVSPRPASAAPVSSASRPKTPQTAALSKPDLARAKSAVQAKDEALAAIATEAQTIAALRNQLPDLSRPPSAASTSDRARGGESDSDALKSRVDELQRCLDERNSQLATLRDCHAAVCSEVDVLRKDIATNLRPELCRLQRETAADLSRLRVCLGSLAERLREQTRHAMQQAKEREQSLSSWQEKVDSREVEHDRAVSRLTDDLRRADGHVCRHVHRRCVRSRHFEVAWLQADVERLQALAAARHSANTSPDTTAATVTARLTTQPQQQLSIEPQPLVKQETADQRDFTSQRALNAECNARAAQQLPAEFDMILIEVGERERREAVLKEALARVNQLATWQLSSARVVQAKAELVRLRVRIAKERILSARTTLPSSDS